MSCISDENIASAKRLIDQGSELELTVFAMSKHEGGGQVIADNRVSVESYDIVLKDLTTDDSVLEFDDLSEDDSCSICSLLEDSLNLVACAVGG